MRHFNEGVRALAMRELMILLLNKCSMYSLASKATEGVSSVGWGL